MIGKTAFYNCDNLSSIILPESVSFIGDEAFTGCDKLIVQVPEGSYAEQYCEENGILYDYTRKEESFSWLND